MQVTRRDGHNLEGRVGDVPAQPTMPEREDKTEQQGIENSLPALCFLLLPRAPTLYRPGRGYQTSGLTQDGQFSIIFETDCSTVQGGEEDLYFLG